MPTLTGLTGIGTNRLSLTGTAAFQQWGAADAFDFDVAVRRSRYAYNRALLENWAYRLESAGGFRAQVLRDVFGITATDETKLVGIYNPVKVIVDAYQNTLRGSFGQEIKIDENVDDRPVNPALIDNTQQLTPIRRIWKWSMLDTAKATMIELAANLGTVGLRIVARNNTDAAARQVAIQIDSPAIIYDFNEDDRGNVTEIELRYPIARGDLGQPKDVVEVREVLTKTRFVKEVDGTNVLETQDQTNALGVCPYVLLRHRDDGHEFGRWAYSGSDDIIHWINWIVTNQGGSIVDHSYPEWFAAAGGNAPEEFEFGRTKVKYVKMDPDTPPPIFEPKVAPLDQNGAREYWIELMSRLQERQPEIVLGNIKALAGQSGETISKLLIPVESLIFRARAQYENALIRAIQIGLSEGIRMGVWDLGTGVGAAENADAAYRQGLEDFAFNPRAALPATALELTQQADAETELKMRQLNNARAATGIVDNEEQLRIAGYTDEEIAAIQARKATQDVIPTQQL